MSTKRPVISWPWYLRVPVGLLVCVPLLTLIVLCLAIADAFEAFCDRDEWREVASIFIGTLIGNREDDTKGTP